MKYKFKNLTGNAAVTILKDIVQELEGMAVEDLTTLECRILQRCTTNPPKNHRAENKILNH